MKNTPFISAAFSAFLVAVSLAPCGATAATKADPNAPTVTVTSAGVLGKSLDLPFAIVGNRALCYDLSYGSKPSPFSRWAASHGAAKSVMGWGMLVEQAAESFHIWRGVRPDTAPVLKQLTVSTG